MLSYKTEYRLRFRPFTQYEYIGDRFVQSQASLVAPPAAAAAAFLGGDSASPTSARSLHGDPWFTEVIELRKRAKDYMVTERTRYHASSPLPRIRSKPFALSLQCRGWGTDTAAPHMSELYRKQMDLYEQTKRRESLSALSLAITTPR